MVDEHLQGWVNHSCGRGFHKRGQCERSKTNRSLSNGRDSNDTYNDTSTVSEPGDMVVDGLQRVEQLEQIELSQVASLVLDPHRQQQLCLVQTGG